MARKVNFEGVEHTFPDDATDDEVRSALESSAGPAKPLYEKGASESRIGHHLETHPTKLLPSLVDLAVSPVTGLFHIPEAISDWAHGRNNGYPPGMGESPVNQAYGNAVAALAASPGTPKPTINLPPEPPPPPPGSLPTQLPWLAKFAIRRLPMGSELVDVANQYLKNRATAEPAVTRPTPSPTWTPTPIPEPPAPAPPPVPRSSTNRVPDKPASAPKPTPPAKPGPSPSWNRGTISPPPAEEAAAPAVEKPYDAEAIVRKVLAEKAREAVPAPPSGEIAGTKLPDTEAGLHYGIHAAAKDLWGSSPHEPLRQLVEQRYGKNRTMTFEKNLLPEGKTRLTLKERADLLKHLLTQMPEPPK